jgi:DNA-binding LytR/AlgR family response regulator
MGKTNQTRADKAAAILAGMSIHDKEIIETLRENIDNVIYIEGDKHDKAIVFSGRDPESIRITFGDLDVLLPQGKLDDVHESYWINFAKVEFPRLVVRDLFAVMSNGKSIPIRRPDAKAFKEKCLKAGKGRKAKK